MYKNPRAEEFGYSGLVSGGEANSRFQSVTPDLPNAPNKRVDKSAYIVGRDHAGTDKRLIKKLKIGGANVDTHHKRYR